MPQPAVQFDAAPADPSIGRSRSTPAAQPVVVTLGESDLAWAASPARQLHDRLVESFAAPAAAPGTILSRRQRLLILAGSVALLWSMIGTILVSVLR
ncbi:hypothetical protein ACM61V_00795 [Sphingomonas sp. TX0543]|uniref:hypothetical protein n=1 Tax=unclassified Sphingomonas TaxID=196159 RepID=UPI0010F44539|nr:hypothetical protein [Sphingomonas sp. 3P27F8]